ncbi:hypothetical protein [Aurantivibrio infirmus]
MPVKQDQYQPSEEELSIFVTEILNPKLSIFSKELGQNLVCSITSVYQNNEVEMVDNPNCNGICKVCFNRTFNPARSVIYAAARFQNITSSTGFTGFNINAQVKSGVATTKGYTVIYNEVEFPKW